MSISVNQSAFVLGGTGTIGLSQMFSVTAGSSNPAYLVLSGLDRNEYTATATGATGTVTGSGQTARFSSIGGDARTIGIVFTYDAATGRYYNATYGAFDQLSCTASASLNDLTSLSLFGFSSAVAASSVANNPYACMTSSAQYLGSADIATQPGFSGGVPAQATPGSIASVAASFVGKAWNTDGCWVLASTIAAEAGAALPVQSTAIGVSGQTNGEWMVVYNGPAGQSGNWQSMVTAGDIVVIGNDHGLGHITTCVSGGGSTAQLIDNITYVDSYGRITNLANDGSGSDVVVAAPHLASQEWANAASKDAVIYRLDTPVISVAASGTSISAGTVLSLNAWFAAKDPANKVIAQYQLYDTALGDSLQVNGINVAAHSAAAADTVSSLSGACLAAGSSACTDTVMVRAFNGAYWGDWQALVVSVTGAAAPILLHQTANQTWQQGSRVSLAVASTVFTDPQHQTLSYTATLADGGAMPSWLSFNPLTRTFSGTVPTGFAETLSLMVTATDTSGLSASEIFQATVAAKPPALANGTATQTWTEGGAVSLAIPFNTFTDPQGEALRYTATLANGQALPSWLQFDTASGRFSGTAPYSQGYITLKVTATDTSGLSAFETFQANVTPPPPVLTDQTADQAWTANLPVSFRLPPDTFTAVPGQTLRYTAKLESGAALPKGLLFDASTLSFSGSAPVQTGTYTIKVTASEANGLSASETFQVVVGASAPVVSGQTATQTWTAGQKISFALPAGTFTDPQGEALAYSATLADGHALPSGIRFDAATLTFSGTVPVALADDTVKVTATDTSGLSTAETFRLAITADAPQVTSQTADQVWSAGQNVSFSLPATTFTDPQGEALRYTATQSDGQPLPRGLTFNAATRTFSGTAPITPETLGLTVTATDASGLASSESFDVTVAPAAPAARAIANRAWTAGTLMNFLLPSGTFTDPQKSALTYTAFEVGGTDQTSWMHFNPTTADFTGLVPVKAAGTIGIEVIATNAYGLSSSQTFGLTFGPSGTRLSALPFASSPSEMLAIHG